MSNQSFDLNSLNIYLLRWKKSKETGLTKISVAFFAIFCHEKILEWVIKFCAGRTDKRFYLSINRFYIIGMFFDTKCKVDLSILISNFILVNYLAVFETKKNCQFWLNSIRRSFELIEKVVQCLNILKFFVKSLISFWKY